MKKLSVVIVNYNVKHYLRQCLDSVFHSIEHLDADVYVVDNCSSDGSLEFLRPLFPTVHFIASNQNLGFARANNVAIRQSDSEYVLLLNPDTIIGETTLQRAIEFMDRHKDVGAAGVQMLKSSGERAMESRRGLPTPLTAFYKMSGLCNMFPSSRIFGKYYMSYLSWERPQKIEVVSGAFCLLRRSALDKAGLLDEDFFMYGEDIDLSYRVLKAGYVNAYLPLRILHYKGESTQKSSYRYVHVFYEAMLIFFKKHYSHMNLLVTLPVKFAIRSKAAITMLQMRLNKLKKSLGFVSSRGDYIPDYLFIGTRQMLDMCQIIAKKHGLNAKFFETDMSHTSNGHLSEKIEKLIDEKNPTYIVYDTSTYTYSQILKNFSLSQHPMMLIATYDARTQTIITQDEVFTADAKH